MLLYSLQNLDLQEEKTGCQKRNTKDDVLVIKNVEKCETEVDALNATAGLHGLAGGKTVTLRRLGDFAVFTLNEDGNVDDNAALELEPVETLPYATKPLFVSGIVYPSTGPMNKTTGRRVDKLGPLAPEYLVQCVSNSNSNAHQGASILISTDSATYALERPSASYKKFFANLSGQANILYEVKCALDPRLGGNPLLTLDEVVARIARNGKAVKSFSSSREALLVNGKFILSHLEYKENAKILSAADAKHLLRGKSVDSGARSGGLSLGDSVFAQGLKTAMASYAPTSAMHGSNGGIVIRKDSGPACNDVREERGAETARNNEQFEADEDFARQLQAKMDAEALNGPPGMASRSAQAYIKVSEAEIADDYPPPAAYDKEEEETDELLLFDEELAGLDPEYLPRRLLTDFVIYNADGLFASLELLPMARGIDPDIELYASGVVIEDDGDFSGGHQLGEESGRSNPNCSSGAVNTSTGMRMYLSQIREWVVEFGADMLFITIRTDVSWYRLNVPSPRYAPWFDVPVKCARLAARVLNMLCEESRASKLSFIDVIKRLSASNALDAPESTSRKSSLAAVERFLTVHAPVILSCFNNFPVKEVRNSAFASTLREKLSSVRHYKLYRSVGKLRARINRNPMKDRAAGGRSKPMTATATMMVKSIWQAYFSSTGVPAANGEGEGAVEGAVDLMEDDKDDNGDVDVEAEAEADADVEAEELKGAAVRVEVMKCVPPGKQATVSGSWVGEARVEGRVRWYNAFEMSVGSEETLMTVGLGDVVAFEESTNSDASSDSTRADQTLGLVQAMWEEEEGSGKGGRREKTKKVQVRIMVTGGATVLGDAASQSELFLTTEVNTFLVNEIVGKVKASRLCREWDASKRGVQFEEDVALRAGDEYFWRREYVPLQGMFRDAPMNLQLGSRLPQKESQTKTRGGDDINADINADADSVVTVDGVLYRIGDFMFVSVDAFDQLPEAQNKVELPEYLANSRHHKGSNGGLRAWGIGRLVQVNQKKTMVTLERYWRPEDISRDLAYTSPSFRHVYAGKERIKVSVELVMGPAKVVASNRTGKNNNDDNDGNGNGFRDDLHVFYCIGSFCRDAGIKEDVPDDLPRVADAHTGNKKKSSDVESDEERFNRQGDGIALATMDIFAGCGGLTRGLHQAKAAYTKWAIEYEAPAAEAFKLNNSQAAVFCNNCNVLLYAAMNKAGLSSDCFASEEAVKEAALLSPADVEALPLPGEVEFICGGPPCQGYSGMNRFNKGNWSMVQNSMVMAFLSYADFYRPRYFLLENVRNFVSHNKSFTFRLTLRTLLDMGYQVRFGVLNAGNYGVAQSRKRTFIWAAAPGETLPDWPKPIHAFRSPQLTINLPGNVAYTAVPQLDGAPLRPITVRDAIGDLPPIENGHDVHEMGYSGQPVSAFQRIIRGDSTLLTDHIAKAMNQLNLERCRCIPKNRPGADWRVLEEIVKADPSRELFKGQPLVPWCLPNTADRHNGWRGLFGRLDWDGHFPTSTTDPQPMGKVGQVFHPEQDRIVSVRECARAQGFPDCHRFAGTVQNKHRQVGNAVPPPLAAALGKQLRKALEASAAAAIQSTLDAQM
jgi:DNA (cytosine-5)-methyltransferase 1